MNLVKIIDLNHQGDGIAKLNDKVVFVKNAYPGDLVYIKIIKEHKNYDEAIIEKVEKRNNYFKEYPCKYYPLCGGCNIANLEYEKQLEFKKNMVIDILNKYASITISNLDIVGYNYLNYRNKITLHVKNSKLGYYIENSNELIEIDECLIVKGKINKIIKKIKQLDLSNVEKIVIRNTTINTMVVFYGNILDTSMLREEVDSIYVNDKLVYGMDKIIEKLGNYKFYISPKSFFQVNTIQAYNLYMQVLEYANIGKNDTILDLYCGTGTIGIILSNYAKEVIGIEINSDAIKDANLNKKLNNVNNIKFIEASSSIISKMNNRFDIVIVDPPRSGLDKITINSIIKNKISKLIYVSCNPITLARDLRILNECYDLKNIKLFDMFRETYHCESVVILERR